jgi:hypothetical protein
MRRAAALFSEMTLSLAWPFTPRLLARHASFERLRLFLLLYNLVVMTVTLSLTRELLEAMRLGTDPSAFNLTVRWAEGLFRYIAWTAANFPIAAAFRRRFDADLEMSNADKLAPALLFGRQIFWASLIASLGNDLVYNARAYGAHLVQNATSAPLAAWALGNGRIDLTYDFLRESREVLHVAAVSLFRAGAVTYALFAGSKVSAAVSRVIVAYIVGGFLLFYLHDAGAGRAPAGAERAMARLESSLKRDERLSFELISDAKERVALLQSSILHPLEAMAAREAIATERDGGDELWRSWYAAARALQWTRERINYAFARAEQIQRQHSQTMLRRLASRKPELYFTFGMLYLLPYYSVCVGGAWWLIHRARRKYRPLE